MNNKPTRYYSTTQEKHVASLLGGRVQPNSGATPFFKGDVVARDFLVECKTTTTCKESFSIKKEWLEGVNLERIELRKGYCALAFQFAPQELGQPHANNYFVVDEYTFRKMLEALMQAEGK